MNDTSTASVHEWIKFQFVPDIGQIMRYVNVAFAQRPNGAHFVSYDQTNLN